MKVKTRFMKTLKCCQEKKKKPNLRDTFCNLKVSSRETNNPNFFLEGYISDNFQLGEKETGATRWSTRCDQSTVNKITELLYCFGSSVAISAALMTC